MTGPRILVIGIDGVPFTLLKSLANAGVMPGISQLLSEGQSKPITSSIPDVSSTAWSSFMTGTNPGEHGIYGFFEVKPENYGLRFPTYGDLKVEPFWNQLSARGFQSLVVNVPQTYPARQLNGILISGFVAPKLERAVYPASLFSELQDLDYMIDVDAWMARTDPQNFFNDLFQVLHTRKTTIDHLWSREEWDFVNIVFTGTDRLQHYFWHSITDPNDEFHQSAMDFYHELDRIILQILEKVDDECLVILLSDHGFTEIEREVNLNAWLRQEGYLKLRSDDPESLQDIHPDTVAFALDPGRIYLNLSERYTQGSVKSGDAASILQELKSKLGSDIQIRDRAGNIINPIRNVFLPDDIYHGGAIEAAPDLIVQPAHGIDLKGSVKIQDIFRSERLSGCHTFENASLIVRNATEQIQFDAIQNIQDIIPAIRPVYEI